MTEQAVPRVKATVTIKVVHMVEVQFEATVDQTMAQLQENAMAEYHMDERGRLRMSDTSWRNQFSGRANLSVSPEQVTLHSVQTIPL